MQGIFALSLNSLMMTALSKCRLQFIKEDSTCMFSKVFLASVQSYCSLNFFLLLNISSYTLFAHSTTLWNVSSLIHLRHLLGMKLKPRTESSKDGLGKMKDIYWRMGLSCAGHTSIWVCHALSQGQELCIYRSTQRLFLVCLRLHKHVLHAQFASSFRAADMQNRVHRWMTTALLAATPTNWQRGKVLSQLAPINGAASLG